RVIARTDRPPGAGEDLSARPLVQQALREGEAAGLWSDEGRYWNAVVVPLTSGGDVLVAFLVAGLGIDDALALDLRRQSGAEVAYVTAAVPPVVIASTLGSDQDLAHALHDQPALLAGGAEPHQVTLGGRRWVVQSTPLGVRRAGGARPA